MQDRRGFFASIAGLFAVATVNPSQALDPSFYSNRPDADLAMVPETIKSQMMRLTEFMHAELVKQVGHFPDVGGESKISTEFPHQFGIDFAPIHDDLKKLSDHQIKLRYVLPAMSRMASEIRHQKTSRFAHLPLPSGIDEAVRVSGQGVSLRGLRAYNIGADGMEAGYYCRFDVLFG